MTYVCISVSWALDLWIKVSLCQECVVSPCQTLPKCVKSVQPRHAHMYVLTNTNIIFFDLCCRLKRLEWEAKQEKGRPERGAIRLSSSSSEKAIPESPLAGRRKKSSVRIPAYLKKRMLARANSGDNLVSLGWCFTSKSICQWGEPVEVLERFTYVIDHLAT